MDLVIPSKTQGSSMFMWNVSMSNFRFFREILSIRAIPSSIVLMIAVSYRFSGSMNNVTMFSSANAAHSSIAPSSRESLCCFVNPSPLPLMSPRMTPARSEAAKRM